MKIGIHFLLGWIAIGFGMTGCGFDATSTSTSSTENSETQLGSVANGSFETCDFTDWQTIGDVSIQQDIFDSSPSDGECQVLLSNRPDPLSDTDPFSDEEAVTITQLTAFLGISTSALDSLLDQPPAGEGSAIRTSFQASDGQALSLDWNFLTMELEQNQVADDSIFITISPLFSSPQKLAGVIDYSSVFEESDSVFARATGFVRYTSPPLEEGTYILGVGIVDGGIATGSDQNVDSAVLVDRIQLE
ncbi:MAG: hypothetical protein NW237_12905 [Cyanobacteriota bacterium]|nr:hypothetical protein [Cyanobacteriota bacterium]